MYIRGKTDTEELPTTAELLAIWDRGFSMLSSLSTGFSFVQKANHVHQHGPSGLSSLSWSLDIRSSSSSSCGGFSAIPTGGSWKGT